jgi:hypothetical protein
VASSREGLRYSTRFLKAATATGGEGCPDAAVRIGELEGSHPRWFLLVPLIESSK